MIRITLEFLIMNDRSHMKYKRIGITLVNCNLKIKILNMVIPILMHY